MKRVILKFVPTKVIPFSEADCIKMHAYKTKKGAVCVLSQVGVFVGEKSFAFINIFTPNAPPSYRKRKQRNALEAAIKAHKEVMEFENITEFSEWIKPEN